MRRACAALGLLMVAACGGSPPAGGASPTTPPVAAPVPPAPAPAPVEATPAATCADVGAHVDQLLRAQLASDVPAEGVDAIATLIARVMREQCEAEAWTEAARACMAAASVAGMDACTSELTAAQLASLEAAVQAAVAASPPGVPAQPAPDPDPDIRPPVADDLAGYLRGAKIKGKGRLIATIVTSLGTFRCELFERDAPITVANFVGLATGQKPWRDPVSGTVKKGVPFYQGLTFHRVIPDFMIQAGDPLGTGVGGPGYAFGNELVERLVHDRAGVLAMANAGPDTNGSQFFITAAPTRWLDGRHTIFGRCEDEALVARIAGVERDDGDRPRTPVTIERVTFARRR